MTNEYLETILLLILFFYTVALLGVPVWLAVKNNEVLAASSPKSSPYKWGYFWGYFSIFAAPLFIVLLWFNPETKSFDLSMSPSLDKITIEALYSIALAVIGFGLVKRMQLAWIASVSMNAISFVLLINWVGLGLAFINAYYFWKRRQDLISISFSNKK